MSAVLFYLLAGSAFLAAVFLRNDIADPLPSFWLSIIDLPLLAVGMLYGGSSVYLSFGGDQRPSTPLAFTIALPLLALFLTAFVFNFWPLLS